MSNLEQNTTPVDGSTEENGNTVEYSVTQESVQDHTEEPSSGSSTELTEEDILNMSDEQLSEVSFTDIGQPNSETSTETTEPANQVEQVEQVNTDTTTDTGLETKPEEVSEEIAFYREVTAPFKANNTQVQIKDPKDAIRLMQMGLNYNEKMASLKPHMRILRSLDKAGLLDESKLNHLIDLANHKPEAIAQLLKESAVDTYNLPDLEETPYQANNYMVSDAQVAFEDAINNAKSTAEGNEVLTVINSWDDASMGTLFENPMYIDQLVEQKQSGLFDATMAVIKRDIALGKLNPNQPMVNLYNDVASYLLQTEGDKFAKPSWWSQVKQPNLNQSNTQGNAQQQQQVQQPQRTYLGSNEGHQTQASVKANTPPTSASITKGAVNPVQTRVEAQDILNMSDEEFEQFQRTVKFIK